MNYTKEQLANYIDYVVSTFYNQREDLHNQPLSYWQQVIKDECLNSPTYLENPNKIVNDINLIIEKYKNIKQNIEVLDMNNIQSINDNTNNNELSLMVEDNNKELEVENTIEKEHPKTYIKVDNTKQDNKGFAIFLSIIIGILVVIAMILVTMISYTLIK